MKIQGLAPGTRLMWDAPRPFDGYQGKPLSERIIYPALIVAASAPNSYLKQNCVMVRTGHAQNWMGPEQEYLREPTAEELVTLTWPNP